MKKSTVFEQTYQEYLHQLAGIDIRKRAETLGGTISGSELVIPFYGKSYRVSAAGVQDSEGRRANFAVSVVLCKYILLCPEEIPAEGEWMTYREFKDAGPLTSYFTSNTNRIIETTFGSDTQSLAAAGRKLGGLLQEDGAAYDLSIRFTALPRIPVFLRFNARDEEFPPQCAILFKQSAEKFLDMECLAIAGTFLAGNLISRTP